MKLTKGRCLCPSGVMKVGKPACMAPLGTNTVPFTSAKTPSL
ncbi:MAG: hypothetical protein Q8930_06740 [Bacillota bacterium]|nr:hypothetical protein [Bacillota bacterium]